MAANGVLWKNLLLLLIQFSALFGATEEVGGKFTIVYSPKNTRFLNTANKLETSDIPAVVSASLGLSLNEDLKWDGLAEGSLFQRPKGSVILSVIDVPSNSLKIVQFQKSYPTLENDGSLNAEAIINNIERENWKQEPLNVDYYVESAVYNVRTRHAELFSRLPSTIYGLTGHTLGADWFSVDELGSLNITEDVDLQFIGEIYGIKQIITALKENPAVLKLNSPDFFHFSVMGLDQLAVTYGPQSAQVNDGLRLVQAFIQQLSHDFKELYAGNVVVQVVIFSPNAQHLDLRKSRSLLAVDESHNQTQSYRLAPKFTYLYPVMFNIVLWLMIGFALAVFGIGWGVWHMDPGRDSLIYRMTSQRMKKD